MDRIGLPNIASERNEIPLTGSLGAGPPSEAQPRVVLEDWIDDRHPDTTSSNCRTRRTIMELDYPGTERHRDLERWTPSRLQQEAELSRRR